MSYSYLFIKNIFQRESFYYFLKKLKILKKPKTLFLVGFFRWVFRGFLGGVFIANPGARTWT
jgi:hypothetical protein